MTRDARAARRRVLFVERAIGFGGSTVGLMHAMGGFPSDQWERIVVVCSDRTAEWVRARAAPGDEVHVLPMRPPRFSGTSRAAISRVIRSPLAAADSLRRAWLCERDLAAVMGDRDLDLVFANNGVSVNRAAISFARRRGAALVVKQRGFEWLSADVARIARRVDLFLPDSVTVAAQLAHLGVPRNRIRVNYCAVEPGRCGAETDRDARVRIRQELGIPPHAAALGIVGMLLPWKGQRVFLDAAKRVLERTPQAVGVIVGGTPSGEDDEYSRSLRLAAERAGIADRVLFTGYRDDVGDVLQALDVVVHASTSPEPFGTAVAEAMAATRPVIVSAAGGPTEYVEDGRTGRVYAPGDAAGLADAILDLLHDPVDAARLAQAGRKLVARRFDAERHRERTQHVVDSLLRTDPALR